MMKMDRHVTSHLVLRSLDRTPESYGSRFEEGLAEQKLTRKCTEGIEDIPILLKLLNMPSWALQNTLPSWKARGQRGSLVLRKEFTILSV